MRTPSIIGFFAIVIGLWGGKAEADPFHMPCDKPVDLSIGTGIFTGNSDTSRFGAIEFERIQPTFLRLGLTFFSNCEAFTDERDDDKPAATHDRVTRWWLGSLSFYGTITPETTSLAFHAQPQTDTTVNGLTKADLKAGTDMSGGLGLALSLIDSKHFHVEAYAEAAGTFGWNPARADTVVAHALSLDIDVTDIAREHARLRYRWDMENVGLTIGFPIRPNTVSKNRLTPYLSAGYTWFNADVDIALDQQITDTLTTLGVDTAKVTERRSIRKSSPTIVVGARLDLKKSFSLAASAMFMKTPSTTVYWFSGEATLRFNWPWKL